MGISGAGPFSMENDEGLLSLRVLTTNKHTPRGNVKQGADDVDGLMFLGGCVFDLIL